MSRVEKVKEAMRLYSLCSYELRAFTLDRSGFTGRANMENVETFFGEMYEVDRLDGIIDEMESNLEME